MDAKNTSPILLTVVLFLGMTGLAQAETSARTLVGNYSNMVWSDGEDPHAVSGYEVRLYKNGTVITGDMGIAIGSPEPEHSELYDISFNEEDKKISFKVNYSRGIEIRKGLPPGGRDAKTILTFSGKLNPRQLKGEITQQEGYPPFKTVGKEKSILRKYE